MNKSLHAFNFDEADKMINEEMIFLENNLFNKSNENSHCANMVFCITGKLTTFKNRDEAKQKIEAAGGKVTNSVTGNTTYLVNNDINSTSSKNVKAKSLNIPIISENELLAML